MEACTVSISPSITCTKLDSYSTLLALRWFSGTVRYSRSGIGGWSSGGPMYAQTKPPPPARGRARILTFPAKLLSAGSDIISMQLPSTSNFQPW